MLTLTPDITPIVGKYYKVPCAKMVSVHIRKVLYVPVIGELHADPQFGVSDIHYHIDGRFSQQGYPYGVNNHGRTNAIVYPNADIIQAGYLFQGVIWRKKKCLRKETGLRPPSPDELPHYKSGRRYAKWVKSMKGKSCKGKRCPH